MVVVARHRRREQRLPLRRCLGAQRVEHRRVQGGDVAARERCGRVRAPESTEQWRPPRRQTALSRFGIEGDDATDCVRALRSAIHGFIVLEAQGDFGLPDPAASFDRLIAVLLKGLLDGTQSPKD